MFYFYFYNQDIEINKGVCVGGCVCVAKRNVKTFIYGFKRAYNIISDLVTSASCVSLTHKNPQRRKIIHGMHPVGHKDRSIRTCLLVEIFRMCNFCGSYGCCLTLQICFSLC